LKLEQTAPDKILTKSDLKSTLKLKKEQSALQKLVSSFMKYGDEVRFK
jgi:hypothetical protein